MHLSIYIRFIISRKYIDNFADISVFIREGSQTRDRQGAQRVFQTILGQSFKIVSRDSPGQSEQTWKIKFFHSPYFTRQYYKVEYASKRYYLIKNVVLEVELHFAICIVIKQNLRQKDIKKCLKCESTTKVSSKYSQSIPKIFPNIPKIIPRFSQLMFYYFTISYDHPKKYLCSLLGPV